MDKLKLFFLLFFVSQSLHALTTCTVNTNSDDHADTEGVPGELRYCLNSMNTDLNSTPDDYEIVFDFPMRIELNGILPIINNSSNPVNITIGNPGSIPTVTIDGNNGAYGGFFIPTGNVTIQNMIFQNMTAKGGDGGNGISGGGGGMGAGGAIYVAEHFLNGSTPSVTLMNVSINNCSAVGGNGGSYMGGASTGEEGGAGGGGFSGNGGSIAVFGRTGGGGGGGFGGNGGDVTLGFNDFLGGGGGGGGGIGSRATVGVPANLGNGGADNESGSDGNGYGLSITAGSGAAGNTGGIRAGGGGGGGATVGDPSLFGGGGGGSRGNDGLQPQGSTPPFRKPLALAASSGGAGDDGGGGGGGGVVSTDTSSNSVDGAAAPGGYGGGGGGGAGVGAYDAGYTVLGGAGGFGGGGGGGGVNHTGLTSGNGGNSSGGGGGGGGGPANGTPSSGGIDIEGFGGGAGGQGATTVGAGFGGGGGGGGSGYGGALFVDHDLTLTIQAMSGVPTIFNTTNTTTQAGVGGDAGSGGGDSGSPGSALGNSIFLRANSILTLQATGTNDLLTLGDQVQFTDDTSLGAGATNVFVKGDGTVIYNGTSDYQGVVSIYNANFKVNGEIDQAAIRVCRDPFISAQRGTLSGRGIMTGYVFANSGVISPDSGETLTLGNLTLNPAGGGYLGSVVHIDIDSGGSSLVAVNGPATLAGDLEINLDNNTSPGSYVLLTSTGITGTFDAIRFTGTTPSYTLAYLPVGAPTYVQLNFSGFVEIPATLNGSSVLNPAVICCGRPVLLGPLPVAGSGPTVYTIVSQTGDVQCEIGQTGTQTYLKMHGKPGTCTIVGTKDGIVSSPLTLVAA